MIDITLVVTCMILILGGIYINGQISDLWTHSYRTKKLCEDETKRLGERISRLEEKNKWKI